MSLVVVKSGKIRGFNGSFNLSGSVVSQAAMDSS